MSDETMAGCRWTSAAAARFVAAQTAYVRLPRMTDSLYGTWRCSCRDDHVHAYIVPDVVALQLHTVAEEATHGRCYRSTQPAQDIV